MEERARRIVEVAVELAEEGGFEAVRQRDVAARAGVALGTLYKRFPSKEGILVAALELETSKLVKRLNQAELPGSDATERIQGLFRTMTRGLCRKPNLAKALIKAVTSGEPELTEKVASYHTSIKAIITRAMCGPDASPSEEQDTAAYLLQQVWFASLVGWMGGLHGQPAVVDHVNSAARLLLQGISAGAQSG